MILSEKGVHDIILEQIKAQGLGGELTLEAATNKNGNVRLRNLMQYIYTMTYGVQLIEYLCQSFDSVEMLEQCSDFFKFRLPKQDRTIGFLFGLIEQKKQ